MPLTEHLLELRRRLLSSFAAVALVTVAAWFVYPFAMPTLLEPLTSLDQVTGLNFRTVLAPFTTRLSISMWAGTIAGSPWWLTQIWLFVAPALDRHHKRTVVTLTAISSLLFFGGAALGWAFLPRALAMLLGEVPDGAGALLDMDSYLRFVVIVTIVMGTSALFPVAVAGVNFLGLVSVRTLARSWRWAVMAAFTFAAITNPLPDVWSMIIQASILITLYYLAIAVCALRQWWRSR